MEVNLHDVTRAWNSILKENNNGRTESDLRQVINDFSLWLHWQNANMEYISENEDVVFDFDVDGFLEDVLSDDNTISITIVKGVK